MKEEMFCKNCRRFIKYRNAIWGRCAYEMSKSVQENDWCIYWKSKKI